MYIIDKYSELFEKNKIFAEYILANEIDYHSSIDGGVKHMFTVPRNLVQTQLSMAYMEDNYGLRATPIQEVDKDNLPEVIKTEQAYLNTKTLSILVSLQKGKAKESQLDLFLAFLPNGNDPTLFDLVRYEQLIESRKERIVDDIIKRVADYKHKNIYRVIDNINTDLNNARDHMIQLHRKKERLLQNQILKVGENKEEFLAMLQALSRNKLITHMDLDENRLVIKTKELPLVYLANEHVLQDIDRIPKDKKDLLTARKLYISPYTITIYLEERELDYTITSTNSNYANYHWDNHKCLGNFDTPIIDAKLNYNIAALANLLLQYLQTVNVADVAGIKTIQEAVTIEDN